MDQLVVGALQEGRVDRDHRLDAFAGHAGGEGERVLFGDAHIEVAFRVFLGETHHAGALAHRRRDRHQLVAAGGHVAQPVSEYLGIRELAAALAGLDTGHVVELADTVVQDGIGFGQLVAVALLRDHVQEFRTRQFPQVFQRRDQRIEVVTVDRAVIMEAELLEQRARRDHALHVFFGPLGEFAQRRRQFQHLGARAAGRVVGVAGQQAGQVLVQRADRRRNRHVVVVEDDQQVGILDARVVQCLEGHAGGHRAVTDHRDAVPALAQCLGRDGHAQRGRDRSGRVGGAEGVVLALAAAREAAHALVLAECGHAFAAAGQHLVGIGLVTDVPHDAVVRRVVDVVQRDRQFHRAEIGRQVAACARDRFQQEGPQFGGQLGQLTAVQCAHGGRRIDGFQQRVGAHRVQGSVHISVSSSARNPPVRAGDGLRRQTARGCRSPRRAVRVPVRGRAPAPAC